MKVRRSWEWEDVMIVEATDGCMHRSQTEKEILRVLLFCLQFIDLIMTRGRGEENTEH